MLRFLTDTYAGLRISIGALTANKLRATLTTLGIVIGVATVVLMISIVQGLDKAFEDQFAFLGSNTVYVSKWEWGNDNWRSMIKRDEMKIAYADRIERESQMAAAVSPFAQAGVTVSWRGVKLAQVFCMGVNEQYAKTNVVKIDVGRFLNEYDVQHNRQVAVIGATLSKKLFDQVNPIGQEISVSGNKFQVIGIQEKQGKFFGQDMDNYVQIPAGALLKRFGKERDMDIVVKARSPEEVDELKWELKGIMRNIRKLDPLEPDDFGVNDQGFLIDMYKKVTGGVYAAGIMIAFISLLVGGIGIMNIMLVSVTERTSEIGLRKALGARRWMISWQFLVESAIICALGGVVGVFLAYLGSQALQEFIPARVTPSIVALGIVFSAVVGIFFGLYPALRASKLSPIEALRAE